MNTDQETARESGCFCMGLGPNVSQVLRSMGPPESVRQHFRNARIEILKGIRAMIDQRIAALSSEPEKGAKINVE